jgi:uncharacterized protein (TIGR02145 family)
MTLETFARATGTFQARMIGSICSIFSERQMMTLKEIFFYSVGYHLKSSPSDIPPWNGMNSAGFSGLPGGKRNYNGMFDWGDEHGVYWSSTPNTSNDLSAWRLLLSDSDGDLSAASLFLVNKRNGLSVRCTMD